jgi:hypothetical protein
VAPPTAALLPTVGSFACNWSIPAEAETEKLCGPVPVQVTFQVAGEAGTVVAVDAGSEVFWTMTGFVLLVVQSPGMVRVIVVSTVVGPAGPLLCRVALPVTPNGACCGAVVGLVTVTEFTLMSVVAVIAVSEESDPELLPVLESATCS